MADPSPTVPSQGSDSRMSWLQISDRKDLKGLILDPKSFVHSGEFRLDARVLRPDPQLHPVFRDMTIAEPITFPPDDRKFDLGVSFVNVIFEKDVDLSLVHFYGPAYFWGCTFKGEFRMSKSRVQLNQTEIHRRDAGEVNFSYCKFDKMMRCERALFAGSGYLHRTIFSEGACFAATKFEKPFIFEGSERDVGLPKVDLERAVRDAVHAQSEEDRGLIWMAIRNHMLRKGIIFECEDWDSYYNFNPSIISTEGLLARLSGFGSSDDRETSELFSNKDKTLLAKEKALSAVLKCWALRYLHTMFADAFLDIDRRNSASNVSSHCFDKRAPVTERNSSNLTDFRAAHFAKGTAFRNVDLSYCMFAGSNASELDFVVSYWAQQLCNPVMHRIANLGLNGPLFSAKRYALRDELELERKRNIEHVPDVELRGRLRELSELYRELRQAYVDEGNTLIGRDFFFGELEMDRLSMKPWPRFRSLSFAYKAFAGYSRQEGLACVWLLLVVVLFAGAYCGIDIGEHGLVRRSLEQTQSVAAGKVSPQAEVCDIRKEHTDTVESADAASGGDDWWRAPFLGMRDSLEASSFLVGTPEMTPMRGAGKALDDDCNGVVQYTNLPFGLGQGPSVIGFEELRRVLQSLERLLVGAQLLLIAICLRSRFQRIT